MPAMCEVNSLGAEMAMAGYYMVRTNNYGINTAPPGLTFTSANRSVSGTATTAGVYLYIYSNA
jgi:hypothetical protein